MQVQGNRPQGAARRAVPVDGCVTATIEFLRLKARRSVRRLANAKLKVWLRLAPGHDRSANPVHLLFSQADEFAPAHYRCKPDFRGSPRQLQNGCAWLNADSFRGIVSFRLSEALARLKSFLTEQA